jgi:hypothetical protein
MSIDEVDCPATGAVRRGIETLEELELDRLIADKPLEQPVSPIKLKPITKFLIGPPIKHPASKSTIKLSVVFTNLLNR